MPAVSAFADEIDADPKLQMDTLEANGISFIELRGAWDTNIMKLTSDQCSHLQTMFADRGFRVACIASPIGKVRIDENYDRHFDDFKHAVDLAEFFGAGYIRIFSYYPPQDGNIADYAEEVLRRLAQKCDYIADLPVTLALENESKIFGDTPERCEYLLKNLQGRKLTAAFDPANFVHIGVPNVYETAWKRLQPYVGYFHMKDMHYNTADGPCVPVGQGDGQIEPVLADAAKAGYDGFLALEPHLQQAGQFAGKTGAQAFGTAVGALRGICTRVGLPLR
jgi:3-dehydroshikimate dehydratase